MPIKVKKEFQATIIGFNNCGLPLGERKDLHLLLDDCIGENNEHRNPYILSMFEQIPTKEELRKIREKAFNTRVLRTKK